MAFQRRHYEMIASSIGRTRMAVNIGPKARMTGPAAVRLAAIDLAATFAADNSRFDRDRFLRACGIDA